MDPGEDPADLRLVVHSVPDYLDLIGAVAIIDGREVVLDPAEPWTRVGVEPGKHEIEVRLTTKGKVHELFPYLKEFKPTYSGKVEIKAAAQQRLIIDIRLKDPGEGKKPGMICCGPLYVQIEARTPEALQSDETGSGCTDP